MIAAAAFCAGSLEIEGCAASRPVSVLHLHGLADESIPIDGGKGEGVSSHTFHSPRSSITEVASSMGCGVAETSQDTTNPDLTTQRWSDCAKGVDVQFVTVEGAEHPWMGHSVSRLQERLSGTPYSDLDASEAVWEFLSGWVGSLARFASAPTGVGVRRRCRTDVLSNSNARIDHQPPHRRICSSALLRRWLPPKESP